MNRPPLIMSVDVEDWFQVENLKPAISRDSWDSRESRVEANTDRILRIFSKTGTTATFFVLGWVAERYPEIVRRIHRAGHEIASHGYGHELVYDIGPDKFKEDIVRAHDILTDLTGQPVGGYRAPSFSITNWALDILGELGYRYDSSFFSFGAHERYSTIDLPDNQDESRKLWFQYPNGIREYPILTHRILGKEIPWGGGGYFRLYPAGVFRRGLLQAARRRGGGVFYIHPWETDPGQPRMTGLPRSYGFRHYVNLGKAAARLEALCRAFRFSSFRDAWDMENR